MQIYKTKEFGKWALKEGLEDQALLDAVDEIARGLVDADLGGHVLKKRVALSGRGKSSGSRTILAYRYGDKAFFVFGFAKNARSNISVDELKALKHLAKELLAYSNAELAKAIKYGALIKVENNG